MEETHNVLDTRAHGPGKYILKQSRVRFIYALVRIYSFAVIVIRVAARVVSYV